MATHIMILLESHTIFNMLHAGCKLTSQNQAYELEMQQDCKVLLRDVNVSRSIWSPVLLTGAYMGPGCSLVLEPDSHVVLYGPTGDLLWSNPEQEQDSFVQRPKYPLTKNLAMRQWDLKTRTRLGEEGTLEGQIVAIKYMKFHSEKIQCDFVRD
ncbi:hypothetical protein SELMODRAFT_406388 [Selaginella moellendorffii]|uniref:Bulb-type lectin domain-containing protein n=1 Tax=Selaginella moellendorffii TaxID=88036 RepID=D8R275_SELML|nr:hypothetical protein SELMODRAFT_406388 [Selaginella moellendorffii]